MRKFLAALAAALVLATGVQALPGRPQGFGGGRPGFRFVTAAPVNSGCTLATPITILGSKLVAWWDHTDQSTMTFGTGLAVASIRDKANGYVATQSTATRQPTYSSTARNGVGGITYDGTKDQYFPFNVTGTATGTSPIVMMIAQYQTGSGVTVVPAILNGGYFRSDGTQVQVSNGGTDINTGITSINLDRFIEWTRGGPTSTVVVDGGTPGTFNLSISNGGGDGNIGRFSSDGYSLRGVVQQFLLTNAAMTTREGRLIRWWESWADGKNGSNLPTGDTFQTRAPCTTD